MQFQELTAKQKSMWGDTASLMTWKCPGFVHIFYKLLIHHDQGSYPVASGDIPTAATDAKNILVNPDWFFGLKLQEQVFVAAHEIGHNMYGDVELLHRCQAAGLVPQNNGKALPFDLDMMNRAMDYRLNALLVESNIGKMPEGGCFDLKIATANDSVLDVYKKLHDMKKNGNSPKGKSFDQLLPPGNSTGQKPEQAVNDRNAQQWNVEMAQAMALEEMASRRAGKMAGALQRMFKEFLEPEVYWLDHIQATLSRRTGSGGYNWRKPDRRAIVRDLYMPGRSGHGCGWLLAWGDTSGSMSAKDLESYFGEIAGIVEDLRPRRLTVVWCDSKIHHVDEITDPIDLKTIRARGVGGGGGTSVVPVLDWVVNENNELPEVFIGFTDGEFDYPKEPAFPVIWASVQEHKYPWGDVVRINTRKGGA